MSQFKTNTPEYKQYRKNLRRHATLAEKKLWKYIKAKQLGIHFRRQFGISNYIVDFYCHEKKLIIELDGLSHADEHVQRKDSQKELYLKRNGYTVLRYTDEQVTHHTESVLQDIYNHII